MEDEISARRDPDGVYRFQIDAFTPETMPMARLAEYLGELAMILGEPKSVHLMAIEAGSTTLVHRVEREAIPKVRDRTTQVRVGRGPRDAQRAFDRVNRLLREDNASAVLRNGRKKTPLLVFPGREKAQEPFPTVKQLGSIDGIVARVGGVRDQVPILLQSDGDQIVGCHARRETAKELAHHLFEPVRLHGRGYWRRDADGHWDLDHFRVESFDLLDGVPLSSAVDRLRAAAEGFDSDAAIRELATLRHGKD